MYEGGGMSSGSVDLANIEIMLPQNELSTFWPISLTVPPLIDNL